MQIVNLISQKVKFDSSNVLSDLRKKDSKMQNDLPHLPIRENIKLWNRTATECYENNCECKTCFLYKTYFEDKNEICHMKFYVDYLLKNIGTPAKKA